MGTIQVPGVGTFQVDNSFGSLPADQQGREVDAMVAQARQASPPPSPSSNAASLPPGFQLDPAAMSPAHASLPPGFTIDPPAATAPGRAELPPGFTLDPAPSPPPANDPDVPLSGQQGAATAIRSDLYGLLPGSLKRGIAYAETGAADTLDATGAHGLARDVRGVTDGTAAAQPSTTGDLVSSLRQGRLLRAATDVPGAVLEGLPSALPAIGAAALTEGAAIPAMVGAATGALTQTGDIAKARAASDGRAQPNATDLAVGLGAGAGLGAVGTAGLGNVGSSALDGVIRSAAARAAILHGAADAGVAAGQGLASTAGTQAGAQVDPASIGAQAILGASTRAALSGAGAIGDRLDGTTAANAKAAQAASFNALDPSGQADVVNRAAALAALKGTQGASTDTITPTAATIAARTTTRDLSQGIGQLAAALKGQGIIDSDGVATIGRALGEARNSQGALTQDHLDAIDGLGLDPNTGQVLKSTLGQIDLLSDAGIAKRGTGPIEGAARALGGEAAGGVIGTLGGGPIGAGVGIVAGHVLKPYVAGLLGGFGSKLDQVLGTSRPSLIKEGAAAAQMLQASGLQIPDTRADLLAAIGQQRNAVATQAAIMGLGGSGSAGPTTAGASAGPQGTPVAPPAPVAANVPGAAVMNAAAGRAAARTVLSGAAAPTEAGTAPGATALASQPNGVLAQASASASAGGSSGPGVAPGAAATGLSAPLDGPVGLSPDAMRDGQLLPEWQYALGKNLQDALVAAGTPRALNYAQEVSNAVNGLRDDGVFDQPFADKLMSHDGRVVRGLFNLVRNRMILEAGAGDRRVLAAQAAAGTQASPEPMLQAAE